MYIKFNIKILIITLITIGYLFVSLVAGNDKFVKSISFLNNEQRQILKKYFFPYRLISQQEQVILNQQKELSQFYKLLYKAELYEKESLSDILTKESINNLTNNLTLRKYQLTSGFYSGMRNSFPGSGYVDFHYDNIIVLSSRGILAFKKDIQNNKESFKQIKNNINDYIGAKQFEKLHRFSTRDIFIFNNKVFISYVDEIKKDCWNTSVIYGDMDYENIKFRKLFSSKDCIHSKDNPDKEFAGSQTGGRIVSLDNNHILLSVGDFRSRYLAQDKKSINGKIIKININNNDYKIISMGHRNPQGLLFDKENNFILETEHGPDGGDEINLIEIDKINNDKIQNYGWAISSAGEHYGGKSEANESKYKKYPLYKSHSEHGFIEPLYSFTPSIAISEIAKIKQNKYVVSSMKDKSLYFFEINSQKQIINLDRVEVFERIRDLIFKNNKLYLFMENTASIGVINLG